MESENIDLIREFCAAWSRRDIDDLLGYLADDAVYHNIPMPAVTGHDAIRSILQVFLTPSQAVDWEILHVAARGDIVFAERVDRYEMVNARWSSRVSASSRYETARSSPGATTST